MQSCYLNDLALADTPALIRMAREPGFFYAYISENHQPAWLGVARFMLLALRLRLRRPRHWFKAIRSWPEHRLLGCVILLDMGVVTPHAAEIAYFTSTSVRRQGIAQTAALSVAHWAQQLWGLNCLYASVDPDNPASLAILTRLGLTPVKFLPADASSFTNREGVPRPCWVMQSTPHSFSAALARLDRENLFPVLGGQLRPRIDPARLMEQPLDDYPLAG